MIYVNTSYTPEEGAAHSPSWPNGLVITSIIIIIIIISTSGYYSTTYSTAVAAVCNDSKNYIMETKR
jgi:hypothetical protein